MNRVVRAKLILTILFLVEMWFTVAVIPSPSEWPPGEPANYLVVTSGASLLLFLMGFWGVSRGKFRWHIEGAMYRVNKSGRG
jgi:hypothetical protein